METKLDKIDEQMNNFCMWLGSVLNRTIFDDKISDKICFAGIMCFAILMFYILIRAKGVF